MLISLAGRLAGSLARKAQASVVPCSCMLCDADAHEHGAWASNAEPRPQPSHSGTEHAQTMVVYVKPQLHQLCRQQQQQPSLHMNDTTGYGHLQQPVAGSSSLCVVQGWKQHGALFRSLRWCGWHVSLARPACCKPVFLSRCRTADQTSSVVKRLLPVG
jgi:hypothetical protein